MRHSYKHSLGASLLPLLLWAPHDTSSDDARELFSTILHLVVVPSSLSAFTLHAHMYGSILVGELSKCWWIHIPGFCSAGQPGNVNSSKAEFLCCSREISTGWGMPFLDSKICWLYTTRHELDPDIFHQILGSANEGNSVRHGFLQFPWCHHQTMGNPSASPSSNEKACAPPVASWYTQRVEIWEVKSPTVQLFGCIYCYNILLPIV